MLHVLLLGLRFGVSFQTLATFCLQLGIRRAGHAPSRWSPVQIRILKTDAVMNGAFCFHETLSRTKAEELLMKESEDGSFLIRKSESIAGAFVLCVIFQSQVYSYRILPAPDGGLYFQATKKGIKFINLDDLIKAYQQRLPEDTYGLVCSLKKPIHAPLSEAADETKVQEEETIWTPGFSKKLKNLAIHYHIVKIDETSEEFKKINEMVFETLPKKRKIISVERIENGDLRLSYAAQEQRMEIKSEKSGKRPVIEERNLFHGTSKDIIEAICHQGFDFRLSGSRHGARYGKGTYFAKEAKYADRYTDKSDQSKKMILTRVLVGEYVKGDKEYLRPPAKSQANPHDLYDSCVDDVTDPKIFVIFTQDQAYPEYIITYKEIYWDRL